MKNLGEQFLHRKDSGLHVSKEVEHEKKRKKRLGEKVSEKPVDKLADWMKVLERTHMGHRDDLKVMERIKSYYHKKHVIKKGNVPQAYFDLQGRIAVSEGRKQDLIDDGVRIEKVMKEVDGREVEVERFLFPEKQKKELSEVLAADQKSSLDGWFDYLTSADTDMYPTWVKYWVFNGMVKLGKFDKEKHVFGRRDKTTVVPFTDLNREALAYTIEQLIRKVNKERVVFKEIEEGDTEEEKEIKKRENEEFEKLLNGANFGKLYVWAIEKATKTTETELENIEGRWVKYDWGSDHGPLVESLQGYGTGWCTAGESVASVQLTRGDFYVYYSENDKGEAVNPRVAIRMEGGGIAEVRGIAAEQNMDAYIQPVLSEKMEEFGVEGEKYKKRVEDMRRLTEIEQRVRKSEVKVKEMEEMEDPLTKEDLVFLYETGGKIEGFGYQADPRIGELKEGRDVVRDYMKVFGCRRDQVATKPSELNNETRVYVGDMNAEQVDFFNNMESGMPLHIDGYANFKGCTSLMEVPESLRDNPRVELPEHLR